jgi:anti-sigma factor RsiW
MSPDAHPGPALSAWLDGEVDAAEAASLASHTAACPACALELEEVRAARSVLRGLPQVEPPPGVLRPAAAPRPVRRRPLVGAAAGVALLLASGAALVAIEPVPSPAQALGPAVPPATASRAGPTASLLSVRQASVDRSGVGGTTSTARGSSTSARVRHAAARVVSLIG